MKEKKLLKKLKDTKAQLRKLEKMARHSTDPAMIPRGIFRAAAAKTLDDVESRIQEVRDWTDVQITNADSQDSGIGRLQELQRLMGEALQTVDRIRDPKATPRPMPAPTLIPQQQRDLPTSARARLKTTAITPPDEAARARSLVRSTTTPEQAPWTAEQVAAATRAGWTSERLEAMATVRALDRARAGAKPSTDACEEYLPNLAMPHAVRVKAKELGLTEETAKAALRFLGHTTEATLSLEAFVHAAAAARQEEKRRAAMAN